MVWDGIGNGWYWMVWDDVLFADDTLVIGSCGLHVEEYMGAIEGCGREYGLQVHWGKIQVVPICSGESLSAPGGQQLENSQSLMYLGSAISSDGRYGTELARKIGAAFADLACLSAMWRHSAIPAARKMSIFDAVIVSKLRYSAASAWLSKGCLRKLDGFHCRCLRQILGIKPSFVSRVSNAQVRKLAQRRPLSLDIRRSQLMLLWKVLQDHCKAVLREVAFHGSTGAPLTDLWVRRVGRPRHEWATQLLNLAKHSAGSIEAVQTAAMSRESWMKLVDRACDF